MPPELLTRITCRSRRGERRIEHVVDGEPLGAVSLHGVRRLAPESARELEELVGEDTRGAPVNAPRRRADRRL